MRSVGLRSCHISTVLIVFHLTVLVLPVEEDCNTVNYSVLSSVFIVQWRDESLFQIFPDHDPSLTLSSTEEPVDVSAKTD